jgi:hypothetical protein
VRQRDPSSSVVLTLSNLRKHNSDGKPTDFVFTTWEGPNRFVGYINKEHSPPVPEFSSAVRRPREIAARFDLPFLLSRAMNVTTAKDKRPKGRDQHVNNRNRESGLASPRHSESSSIPYGRSVTISRGLRSPRTLATTSELVASPHSTWCGPSSQRSPSRNCVDQPFSAARRTIWQIRGSATGWLLVGMENGSPIRWSFNEIRSNSFTWRGERGDHQGQWSIRAEFQLQRIA